MQIKSSFPADRAAYMTAMVAHRFSLKAMGKHIFIISSEVTRLILMQHLFLYVIYREGHEGAHGRLDICHQTLTSFAPQSLIT